MIGRFSAPFGLQHNNPLALSHKVQTIENRIDREPQVNWSKVKYSTIEGTLGLELRVNIIENLTWTNYVGMSVYNHPTGFINSGKMYHEKQGLTLCLGTGLRLTFSQL
jgi:hypothetical protein